MFSIFRLYTFVHIKPSTGKVTASAKKKTNLPKPKSSAKAATAKKKTKKSTGDEVRPFLTIRVPFFISNYC